MDDARQPQVTVITPVGPQWNANHMKAAAGSLAGTAATFEWLIVCDGADPAEVRHAVGTSPHIRVLGSIVNHGTASARNAGLAAATGTWTYAFDADDISLGGIDKLLATATAAGAVWAAGRGYDTDETGEHITYVPAPSAAPFTGTVPANGFLDVADTTGTYPFLCSGATIIRTDVARALGGWSEELRDVSEDVALIAKLSARYIGGWVDDGFVLAYRKHPASTTARPRDDLAQACAWARVRQGAAETRSN